MGVACPQKLVPNKIFYVYSTYPWRLYICTGHNYLYIPWGVLYCISSSVQSNLFMKGRCFVCKPLQWCTRSMIHELCQAQPSALLNVAKRCTINFCFGLWIKMCCVLLNILEKILMLGSCTLLTHLYISHSVPKYSTVKIGLFQCMILEWSVKKMVFS